MWRTCMSIMVSGWILATPALWPHRAEQAVLVALVGLAGLVLSMAAVARPRLLVWVFAVGGVLAAAAFAFAGDMATMANDVTAGLLLMVAGMFPPITVTPAAAQPAARQQPPAEVAHRKAA